MLIFHQNKIDEYKLQDVVSISKGWIYMEIRSEKQCTNQAIQHISRQETRNKELAPYEYHKVIFTTGLWKHVSCDNITFILVVNNFSVKYINKKDATHLKAAIKENYP